MSVETVALYGLSLCLLMLSVTSMLVAVVNLVKDKYYTVQRESRSFSQRDDITISTELHVPKYQRHKSVPVSCYSVLNIEKNNDNLLTVIATYSFKLGMKKSCAVII